MPGGVHGIDAAARGPAGPSGAAGATGPTGPTGPAGGGGVNPLAPAFDWLGYALKNQSAVWFGGSYSYGRAFYIGAVGVSISGVDVFNADTVARTFKVSIWKTGGTRLATATATVAPNTRARILFSTPYVPVLADLHTVLFATAWETGGNGYGNTAGALPNAPGMPIMLGAVWCISGGFYAGGDAIPTTADGGIALVFPVFT